MASASTRDQLDYAMKHFVFIADQRIKSFNFYVILFAASIAATVSAIDKLPKVSGFIACGFIHVLVAVLFAMMDQRSRRLVKLTLGRIKQIELADDWPEAARLSNADAEQMGSWRNRLVSFTGAFRMAFLIQALVGIGMLICGTLILHH